MVFRFPRWLAPRIVDPLDQILNLSIFLSMVKNFSALNNSNFFRIWLFLTLRLILSLFTASIFVWLFIFWGCGDSVVSLTSGFEPMSLEITQQKLQNLLEYETDEYMSRQGYQKPFDRINSSFFAVHVISFSSKLLCHLDLLDNTFTNDVNDISTKLSGTGDK